MFGLKIVAKVIAPELTVKFDEDDFTCFDFEEDTIVIGGDFDGEDYGFMRHLREVHNFADADKFSRRLWTILHEVGHYETDGDCEDDTYTRAMLGCFGEEVLSSPKIQDLYFNLKSEWVATEWAIDWIQSHKFLAHLFNFIVIF